MSEGIKTSQSQKKRDKEVKNSQEMDNALRLERPSQLGRNHALSAPKYQ